MCSKNPGHRVKKKEAFIICSTVSKASEYFTRCHYGGCCNGIHQKDCGNFSSF